MEGFDLDVLSAAEWPWFSARVTAKGMRPALDALDLERAAQGRWG